MAESPHNPDANAPQNPPRSVVNKEVRRSALRTYFVPLIVFFAGVAVLLVYWWTSPQPIDGPEREGRVEATTGTERARSRDDTPGGQNPDQTPSRPDEEVEARTGTALSELGEAFEGESAIGRRIEVQDVDVERVESPTLFWVRDGTVRVAVVATAASSVQPGDTVNIVGAVERSGETVRIRASRVEPSR